MRHTVHIMFSEAFSEALLELKKYVTKYGDQSVGDYFTALLYTQKPEEILIISEAVSADNDKDNFISGVNDLYKFKYKQIFETNKEEKQARLKAFLLELKNSIITITNPGDFDNLHICLYFPLYQPDIWEQVHYFIDIAKSEKFSTDIDIIGFASDMAELFTPKEKLRDLPLAKDRYDLQSASTLKQIIEYKKKNKGNIAHFIAMQNSQSHGVALALNMDSFTRIIGEFALLCTECYSEIFSIGVSENDLQAIGLSMLSFDKFYFIEYLLQRTYLHAMDKEKINDQEVDINMASNKAQEMISKWIHLMSDFFDREIKPRLDRKLDQNSIVMETTPLLDEEFDKIGNEFEAYIEDDQLSIPEKRAILAALLGQDDTLFVNYIFNRKQLIIDDLDRQAIMIYIDANNKLLSTPGYENRALLSSDGTTPAIYPLDSIRDLRMRLRQSVAYIRELQKEAQKLETQISKQEDANKCLIKDGYFIFGDQQYKLIPPNIKDEPLTENYTPHPVKSQSIDLRKGFTDIKNQGQQGACLAFTLTSIYEFFLKQNKDPEPNLSEAFLYYNARDKDGKANEDAGSSLQPAVEVLTELGICTEALCPYSDTIYSARPSEAAYEDAKGRKVRKALNVACSLEAIKSALEDGYPVAISVCLYPSFGNSYKGIIPLPTEEDKNVSKEEQQHGRHAMVICGYSDESKIFIVRNSWGTEFGDKGYCYMPYSYMTDATLINWACIITEIETYKIIAGNGERSVLHFDTKDAELMYAITQNLIHEEELFQNILQTEDDELQEYYFKLKQRLKNKNTQDDITDASTERLKKEIEEREQEKGKLLEEKQAALTEFTTETHTKGLILGGTTLLVWIVGYLLYEYVSEDTLYWVIAISLFCTIFSFLYFPWRASRKRMLEQDWNEQIIQHGIQIEQLKKERDTLHLRMHLAGMLLVRLFELSDRLLHKYNVMRSFVRNLTTWYNEEEEEQRKMNANTQPPFISLLRNDILDTYFEKNKQEITKNIHLWKFLKGYQLNEDGIRLFKEKLKEVFIKNISSMIADFSVYDYISRNKNYPYLVNDYSQILPLLENLDRKSDIFLQCNDQKGSLNPHKVIFIHTDNDNDTNRWKTTYPEAFSIAPTSFNICSKYKVVVFRLQDLSVNQVYL